MEWTKRPARREPAGRRPATSKVALVEQTERVSSVEPPPEEDGDRRRANRRLKLLAGLLSRGKGDAID